MVKTTEKLKPCPKCGSEDLDFMRIQEVNGPDWYRISCKKCGKASVWSTTTDGAIDSWGTETVNV